jgi:hypothetical protein
MTVGWCPRQIGMASISIDTYHDVTRPIGNGQMGDDKYHELEKAGGCQAMVRTAHVIE